MRESRAITVIAFVVAVLVAAVAIEAIYGSPRPGFVPMASLIILAPLLSVIWRSQIGEEPPDSRYGGLRRLPYFLIALPLAGMSVLLGMDGGWTLMLLLQLVWVYPVVKRFQNQGASRWWAAGLLVPVFNLYVGLRAVSFPEGYNDNRTLDRAAKAILSVVASTVVLSVVATLVVPRFLTRGTTEFEASAIDSLREINSAQSLFAATCGSGFYTPSLAALGRAPSDGEAFIRPDLSNDPSLKDAYTIMLVPGRAAWGAPASCNGVAAGSITSTYFAVASPLGSGGRYFATNQGGTIFESTSEIPVAQTGAPVGATPLGGNSYHVRVVPPPEETSSAETNVSDASQQWDYAEANWWFLLAANQGDPQAQYNLGVSYERGNGVPRNNVQAHVWFNLAAARASGKDRDQFVRARDRVTGRMSSAQVSEAQRLAREWKLTPAKGRTFAPDHTAGFSR